MSIIDTFWDAEGESGNGLYITTLPTGDIKHLYVAATNTVEVPVFPGLVTADIDSIRRANRSYRQWLLSISSRPDTEKVNITNYVPANLRIRQSLNKLDYDYTPKTKKLLDATWTPGQIRLRAHNGDTLTLTEAWAWADAINDFLLRVTKLDK